MWSSSQGTDLATDLPVLVSDDGRLIWATYENGSAVWTCVGPPVRIIGIIKDVAGKLAYISISTPAYLVGGDSLSVRTDHIYERKRW